MRRENILFDLDGTLTNPMESITSGVAYALGKFGIEVENLNTLKKFIGPPLTEALREFYGFSEVDARRGLQYYREIYAKEGLYGNRIYPGISELLAELKRNGKRIMLATSKPEEYAVKILEMEGVLQYFDFIGGNDLRESRPTKEEVIAHVLSWAQDATPENTIMVGDRKYDVIGAHHFGLPCVGVLYGFGGREELDEYHADYIVQSVQDLHDLLL